MDMIENEKASQRLDREQNYQSDEMINSSRLVLVFLRCIRINSASPLRPPSFASP